MRKTESSIDRSLYDYLDKAPLGTWISEILSRRDDFMRDYDKYINTDISDVRTRRALSKRIFEKYGVYAWPMNKDERRNPGDSIKPCIHVPFAVWPEHLFGSKSGEPSRDALEFRKKRATMRLQDMTLALTNNTEAPSNDDAEDILNGLLGEPNDSGYYDCGNTLLLAVNLDRTSEEIIRDIKFVLNLHKPRRNKKLRLDKWKFYLPVYDLKKRYPGITYDEIGGVLSHTYPEFERGSFTFDPKNIENYYKAALSLIDGEYRKYL